MEFVYTPFNTIEDVIKSLKQTRLNIIEDTECEGRDGVLKMINERLEQMSGDLIG